MAAYLLANIPARLSNASGSPAQYMYTYRSGTTTNKVTYTNQAATVAHSNPISADSDGTFPQVWLTADEEYRIKVTCQDGTTLFTWDNISGNASANFDATATYGAGSVQEKLQQIRSVKDAPWNATGNGTTADDVAVAAAVAAAYAAGDRLYWPHGTYLTTGSIPNFHSVQHFGPGRMKRGTDVFYVEPDHTQTNIIYLSPTGSDANDGLSASQPMNTLQAGIDAWQGVWTKALMDGTWRLKLAAGNYVKAAFSDYGLLSKNPLEFEGPAVGGHPNVPTAIITNGANTSGNGLFAAEPTRIMLRDVKALGYQANISSNGVTGYGVYTENFHATDCYWGISASQGGAFLNIKGGIYDNCGYVGGTVFTGSGGAGLRALFHVKLEIGSQNAGTTAAGPIFRNCANGFFCKEFCTGHIDWTVFEDNEYALQLWTSSRANLDGCDFKRNNVCIRTNVNSLADPSTLSTFGTGADANGRIMISSINSNSAGELALEEGNYPGGNTDYRIKSSYPGTVVTATGASNTLDSYTLRAQFFDGPSYSGIPSRKIRVKVKGTLAGTTGTYKRVALRLGASTVTFASFGATYVGDFVYDVDVDFVQTATQQMSSFGYVNGFSPVVNVAAGTVDMSVQQVLALQAYVQNSADSITVKSIEWYLAGV